MLHRVAIFHPTSVDVNRLHRHLKRAFDRDEYPVSIESHHDAVWRFYGGLQGERPEVPQGERPPKLAYPT